MKSWYACGLLMFFCSPICLGGHVPEAAQRKDRKMLELRISYSKNVVDFDEPVEFSCELKNISDKPITIVYLGSNGLLDYLTYYSRGPGENWDKGVKANIHLSDLGLQRLPRVLEPGKVLGFKNPPVVRFSSLDNPRPKPGIYQLKASFKYRDPDNEKAPVLWVESNVVEIELKPKNK